AGQQRLGIAQDRLDAAEVAGQHQYLALALAAAGEMAVEIEEQLRRAAAPAVDGLPVVADGHQADRLASFGQGAVHGLQPVDDLRRDVLELVDQQMTQWLDGLGGQLRFPAQALAELAERTIESGDAALLQQRLEAS